MYFSLIASLSAKATSERISEKLSVSDRTIETDLAQLKKLGILSREGGCKEGKWIINTLCCMRKYFLEHVGDLPYIFCIL